MIIGICGTGVGCGKDTVAEMIQELLYSKGGVYSIIPLALPLKKIISEISNHTLQELEIAKRENDILPILGEGVRSSCIQLAALLQEQYGYDLFCNIILNKKLKNIIIPDIRKNYEINALQPDFMIYVAREVILKDCTINHISCKWVVQNNGTLEELKQQIITILKTENLLC